MGKLFIMVYGDFAPSFLERQQADAEKRHTYKYVNELKHEFNGGKAAATGRRFTDPRHPGKPAPKRGAMRNQDQNANQTETGMQQPKVVLHGDKKFKEKS